jgi:hypothetical protein
LIAKVVYPKLIGGETGMSGVQVEFQGIDWEKEKSKSERGHTQRKARNVRHRKNKTLKKMAAVELESLKRFRRFLHSMNNDELQPLLMEQLMGFLGFFFDDGDHGQNVIRLQHEFASDDILNDGDKLAALTLLKRHFMRVEKFGAADDFLQTLFAIEDLDQMLESNQQHFQGYLDGFYETGDYDENKRLFLQRDLRVAKIRGGGAAVVLELKQNLIAWRVFGEEGGR